MGWPTPRDWSAGQLVTAAMLDEISEALTFLAGTRGAVVTTAETTTSGTFVDLTTPGPAVTVLTGTKAIVHLGAEIDAVGTGQGYMGVAVSGASTVAASFSECLQYGAASGGYVVQLSRTIYLSGLTPGNNVFTAKYATGVSGITFGLRHMIVQPLP